MFSIKTYTHKRRCVYWSCENNRATLPFRPICSALCQFSLFCHEQPWVRRQHVR